MTRLCDALQIPRGITSFVGGGGKTSLINRLARELSADKKVLRLTTTRIYPPRDGELLLYAAPDELERAFLRGNLVTAGTPADMGKLGSPECGIYELSYIADYTLIEADGSRGLPMKAPNDTEPALTGLERMVIAVVGASGFGMPISRAAHRPERYAELLGKHEDDIITPRDAVKALISEHGQHKGVKSRFQVVINQCDSTRLLEAARECAAALDCECVLLSLEKRPNWYELHNL